jgi:hypothetical protein
VPAIEQVVDAVLLRRDRIVVRLADDLEALDVDLVAARRRLSARACRSPSRGVLRQVVGGLELSSPTAPSTSPLDEARAVAQDRK